MKFSSKTTTSTSTSTIANLSSKVAALALFLASLLGVVYGNTYVSLLQKVEDLLKLLPCSYLLSAYKHPHKPFICSV